MPFKFRWRKSVKILPGVKLNFSEKGLRSTTVGGKAYRKTFSKKGVRTSGRIGWFSWWNWKKGK